MGEYAENCKNRDQNKEKTFVTTEKDDSSSESETDPANWPVVGAADQFDQFDAKAYLAVFYETPHSNDAMKIILFFLPNLIYRIPTCGTLLDLGAGPTVHVPLTFRHRVDAVYTSDYAPVNQLELRRWWKQEEGHFDWSTICDHISSIERSGPEERRTMEQTTRAKIRAVLAVDVHSDTVIDRKSIFPDNAIVPDLFDILACIFCLEYASETLEQYKKAVGNALKLLKPGGYLVQGGVMMKHGYSCGGRRFRCHFLIESDLMQCLAENGMETDGEHFRMISHINVFLLVTRKKFQSC